MQIVYKKHYFFTKFTLSQLFSLGAHVGHLKRRLNKSMSVFLLGFRNGLVCVDLNFTIFFLRRALNFLRFVLKARGSTFFFVTNWAPLQRYFKAKFSTRLHFWYSGPSIGFVDTDLDHQGVLYPIVLNNSGVKINFLYSVFFLNILKQEQFLERFFLVESIPSGWVRKKQKEVFSRKSSHLCRFFLRRFLTGTSFDLCRLHEVDFLRFSKLFRRIRSFVRRILLKRIKRFRRSQLLLRRRVRLIKKVVKPMNKHFLFDVGSLIGLQVKKESVDSELERQSYDGRVILRRLRKKRVQFFFVKAKLRFLRNNFSKMVKLRNSNFKKSLLLLKVYRQYLMVTVFSKRLVFRRCFSEFKYLFF